MTPHQIAMVKALANVPPDTDFTAGEMRKHYSYPHDDAAKVLQQAAVLGAFVSYATPSYRAGKAQYVRHKDFLTHARLATISHPEIGL